MFRKITPSGVVAAAFAGGPNVHSLWSGQSGATLQPLEKVTRQILADRCFLGLKP